MQAYYITCLHAPRYTITFHLSSHNHVLKLACKCGHPYTWRPIHSDPNCEPCNRYADRARHIRNKPVVNRDPVAAQLAVLRNTIAQLKSENLSLRRALGTTGTEGSFDAYGTAGNGMDALIERLTQDNNVLESENARLKMELVSVVLFSCQLPSCISS